MFLFIMNDVNVFTVGTKNAEKPKLQTAILLPRACFLLMD